MPSPRRLLLATGNPGKTRELRRLLAPVGWELLTPSEAGLAPVSVVESRRSYLENATLKAVAFAASARMPALADDSGLEVDALDGRPGVLSARYGGPSAAGDGRRYELLLRELKDVPAARRGARFRTVVVLALPGGHSFAREGVVEGRIADAPRGESGFGYDPVFELPDGRTMAELGEEKQELSHRALAIRAMIEVLRDLPDSIDSEDSDSEGIE